MEDLMNERDFKALLRKKIKPYAYIQSMSSYATNGTPDLWVSGNNDVWIEAKVEDPKKKLITPKLSALQRKWIVDRTNEGRNVLTIVGLSTKEAIIYRGLECLSPSYERLDLDAIINFILDEYVL
jgi:hypothetical protein